MATSSGRDAAKRAQNATEAKGGRATEYNPFVGKQVICLTL